MRRLTLFTQQDPRWADQPVLYAPYGRVRDSGSLVVCLAMLASAMAGSPTPQTILARMTTISRRGLWREFPWTRLGDVVPGALDVGDLPWWRDVEKVVLEHLRGGPALLCVDEALSPTRTPHWLLAASPAASFDGVEVVDPWTGKILSLDSALGHSPVLLERAICGVRRIRIPGYSAGAAE